jgi:hypothetical protein
MNDKFDELAKALAQPVARRAALKRFGVGLVGAALAVLGLGNAEAATRTRSLCCSYTCSAYESYHTYSTAFCVPLGTICPTNFGESTGACTLRGQKEVMSCNSCK